MRLSAIALALSLAGLADPGTQSLHAQVPDTAGAVATTRDGVYTPQQARRGAALLRDVCSACHMDDWFKGTFLQAWNGATVGMLYERIRSTMPEDRPSGLENREYADILAYIFEMNGVPSGDEELSSRKSELDQILIHWSQR